MTQRGRRRSRTGAETRSTFDKSPEVDLAILALQQEYLKTGRAKPSMRDLLIEGIGVLLERERLPAMPQPVKLEATSVIEMPKKTGA
jgi:hypothetical protein